MTTVMAAEHDRNLCVEIFCQNCDTVILIDRDQFGVSHECPACGHPLKLPDLPEPILEPDAAGDSASPGDHAKAQEMLQEPASEQTKIWRRKLAEAFQAANHFATEAEVPLPPEEDEPILFISRAVEAILKPLRIQRRESFDNYFKVVTAIGSFSLLLICPLILFHAAALTVKIDARYLIFGIQAAVGLLVINLFAFKFSRAGLRIIRCRKLVVNNYDLLDAGGVFSLLVGFLFLTGGVYWSIMCGDLLWTALLVMAAITSVHGAILFFSPGILNVTVSPGDISPGETGLALIAYVIRVGVILSGVLIGTIPIMACYMLCNIFNAFSREGIEINAQQFEEGGLAITVIALLPLLSYLGYLGFRIVLDFYYTVFRISRDLRMLGRHLVSQDAAQALGTDAPDEEE
jgi:hypothetical protein